MKKTRKPVDYLVGHNKSGINVGDKVKVLKKAKYHERGWNNCWVPSMDASVGNVFLVDKDNGISGFHFKEGCNYPYFVLEKA